jgi:hypothetical protein
MNASAGGDLPAGTILDGDEMRPTLGVDLTLPEPEPYFSRAMNL